MSKFSYFNNFIKKAIYIFIAFKRNAIRLPRPIQYKILIKSDVDEEYFIFNDLNGKTPNLFGEEVFVDDAKRRIIYKLPPNNESTELMIRLSNFPIGPSRYFGTLIEKNNIESISLLLKNGYRIKADAVAFVIACGMNNIEAVKLILQHGGSGVIKNHIAFMIAVRDKRYEILKLFADYNFDFNRCITVWQQNSADAIIDVVNTLNESYGCNIIL